MKKSIILFILVIFGTITSIAQTISFRSTSFTYKYSNSYSWSKSEPSNMLITMDFSNDIITIFSPVIQYYKIIEYLGEGYDSDKDYVVKLRFVDQDGDYGIMRLIQRTSGKSELYIDFSNIHWCYSVMRIYN